MPEEQDMEKLTAAYHQLISAQQTLLISTATTRGVPHISYAPFVQDPEGCFYVFVSDLARHTKNLLQNPCAAIFFIGPEADAQNLFARERVNFSCQAHQVKRAEENYGIQLQALHQKFGNVVSVLRSLPDFHLFSLTPESGQYIVGFGQAYAINVAEHRLSPVSISK